VGDEVHRVLTVHVLLAKQPYGGALCLGEHGHQHAGSGNLLAAGPLDVGHGTLNDALKGGGGLASLPSDFASLGPLGQGPESRLGSRAQRARATGALVAMRRKRTHCAHFEFFGL
jgi:hypothetical protein